MTAADSMIACLSPLVGDIRQETMAPPGLSAWGRALRTLQPCEAWLTSKDWIERDNPRMAFIVARGLILGSMIPASERTWAALMRDEARARLTYLLQPGTILCTPTTPFPAPRRGLPISELDPIRDRILCLCAHGGFTGMPQVSISGATVGGAPVGLSVLGARGSDATLVALAQALSVEPKT